MNKQIRNDYIFVHVSKNIPKVLHLKPVAHAITDCHRQNINIQFILWDNDPVLVWLYIAKNKTQYFETTTSVLRALFWNLLFKLSSHIQNFFLFYSEILNSKPEKIKIMKKYFHNCSFSIETFTTVFPR